ncbi:MAG TPA: metalloregulator ArsR/SmtB family transcription factor [Terriglobales bacterium]|nr:metalloregulator ArsR/SmtB family transcription factor [Terriglobales bacterium]
MGRIATKASPEKINSEQKNSSDHKLTLVLQAIADPARRKILTALKEKGACSIDKSTGLCASDIEMRLHLSQPTISHHMSILRKAGLVEAEKLGQWKWYRRNEAALKECTYMLRKSL